jgi:hypothetical protein
VKKIDSVKRARILGKGAEPQLKKKGSESGLFVW